MSRGPDKSGYLSEDTIAAIATATGGAVSMIRVSGTRASEVTGKLLPNFRFEMPRVLQRVRIRDAEGQALDEALCVFFAAPKSFTGEDCIELHLHGGAFIATRVLEALIQAGARQALPGEFSFRAVRNGKMALTEAEAIADLIAATNDGAVGLALEKLSGAQNQLISGICEELKRLVAESEIGIDFNDQDIHELGLVALQKRSEDLRARLELLQSGFNRGVKIQDGVSVALVGLPNAGKSSFFNALLGEDRAIVSEIPGTTRDVLREKLTLQGRNSTVTLRLHDTAGLRSSSEKIEKIGIERTLASAREADLILLIVDASTDARDRERLMEQWKELGAPRERTIGIVSKTDLVSEGDLSREEKGLEAFGLSKWLKTSAVSGTGIADAAKGIASFCENWVRREPGEILLTRLDHLKAIESAVSHVSRAAQASELDLFAADLRQALHSLSALIGETLPDDILGQIFSQFCIGK